MEVTENIYNWLKRISAIKYEIVPNNNKFILHELDSQGLESGLNFIPIIKRLYSIITKSDQLLTPLSDINSLKDISSAAGKLYNWNLLIKSLDLLQIIIDSDMKALIIAGDRQVISEILLALYAIDTNCSENLPTLIKKRKKNKLLEEGTILLDDIDPSLPLNASENVLEFLILSFCQTFNLNPKPAIGLLAQSGKILLHILTKGIKGNIDPVLSWYDKIIENSDFLSNLIAKSKNNVSVLLIFGSLKSGLLGKDYKIVQKSCGAMICLHDSLLVKDINTWEWFFNDVITLAFKAYDMFKENVTGHILKLLLCFGIDHLKGIFGQLIIDNYPDIIQCFNVISSFWVYLVEGSPGYNNIQNQGVIEYWVEFGLRQAENNEKTPNDIIIVALGFLCDIWSKFADYFEKHEDFTNSILTVIKRACREKSKILKIICYGRLFQLLSSFSNLKNSYAPIIYKILAFALVENYSNHRIREFLLNNFLCILQEILDLPLTLMIDPYLQQFSITTKPKYNTSDFDFFVSIARHPNLTMSDAIILMDSLSKVYYNDPIYSNSAEIPIMLIAGRFIEKTLIKDFLLKIISVGLKIIISKLDSKPKISEQINITKEEIQGKNALSYYKKLVFGFCEKIIHLKNELANIDIQNCLLSAHTEIKNLTGHSIKGINIVLNLLGNPKLIIESYEATRYTIDIPKNISINHRVYSRSTTNDKNKSPIRIIPQNRSRILSDNERIQRLRIEKQKKQKSFSGIRKDTEEREKNQLADTFEPIKILYGINNSLNSSSLLIQQENKIKIKINLPLYLIQKESKEEQELIWILLRKYKKVFKILFKHYTNTGYKKENFHIKAPFEIQSDKKSFINEGEICKMLRDHGINNSLLSTEDLKKIVHWYLQKLKMTEIDYESFVQLIYYISIYIYSKPNYCIHKYPLGLSLLWLINQFKQSSSKLIPKNYYEQNALYGDKDILKILNEKIRVSPEFPLPEGYIKIKEKDIKISYLVPDCYPKAYKICIEIIDDIFVLGFNTHFLLPSIEVSSVTYVKSILPKPKHEEEEDKIKSKNQGIPNNKAIYKMQPLPGYLNLSPSIKLELANLAGSYSNNILLECARLVDDILYTLENNSFQIISKIPKPPGTIINKYTLQKYNEIQEDLSEKKKNESMRRLRKKWIDMKINKEKNLKGYHDKEEEEFKRMETEIQEEKQKKAKEIKIIQKLETENKIREYKLKKEEEENKKNEEETIENQRVSEIKKKKREAFLALAKKKLLESIAEKKNKKDAEEIKKHSPTDKKIIQRKLLMKKLQQVSLPIQQENNNKEQLHMALADPDAKEVLSIYNPGIEAIYNNFCKMAPVPNTSFTVMSLLGFNKFTTVFPIVPVFLNSDEALKIYKKITKRKTSEPGINIQEFTTALVSISLLSLNKFQLEIGKKPESYAILLKEFFDWIGMPKDAIKANEFLKRLNSHTQSVNPRDKKRNKNSLIRNLSET